MFDIVELERKRKHDCDEVIQLHSDIKSMERRFARLLTATRESIKERKVLPASLAALLLAYRTFPAVIKKENKLLADHQEDIERAGCIDEIFKIVTPFLSFLDFEILEDIINNKDLGTESDRQNLMEYIRNLKDFLNSWKVEPCKIYRHEGDLSTRSLAKLCFKLDSDSLSMYRDVKASIARILEVQVHALQLYSIEEGCTELVFLLLKVAVSSLLPLKSLSPKISEVKPEVLKMSLVVNGDTTESVLFKVGCACAQAYITLVARILATPSSMEVVSGELLMVVFFKLPCIQFLGSGP